MRYILFKKTDPGVGVVCLRVCARGIEHALDRVRSAGDVGPASDICECWGDQNHQHRNDADDDEKLQEREESQRYAFTPSVTRGAIRTARREIIRSRCDVG